MAGALRDRDGRPVVVYDGECPFCRTWVERLRSWDGREALRYVPARDLDPEDPRERAVLRGASEAVRLVLPSGRILGGAEAVREIARRIPRLRAAARLLGLPGLRQAAALAYRWIASNRHRFARCHGPACGSDAAPAAARRTAFSGR